MRRGFMAAGAVALLLAAHAAAASDLAVIGPQSEVAAPLPLAPSPGDSVILPGDPAQAFTPPPPGFPRAAVAGVDFPSAAWADFRIPREALSPAAWLMLLGAFAMAGAALRSRARLMI